MTPHIIVNALAGTGKTTTLVEGLNVLNGNRPAITPSSQQQAIWDCLQQEKPDSVLFTAFNKAIADELSDRIPAGYEAGTLHSQGLKILRKSFRLLPGCRGISTWKTENHMQEILGAKGKDFRKKFGGIITSVKKLVSLCKLNLLEGTPEDLELLSAHYGIHTDSPAEVYPLIQPLLERAKDLTKEPVIDFDDMIWLPVVLNLPCRKYDLLLWDEYQDGNRAQQELALKLGDRILLCGDRNQAIYGFAGADSASVDRMAERLASTERGVEQFPLTQTRRCGRAIVEYARQLVPEFEAADTCPDGEIHQKDINNGWMDGMPDDAMILCRINAPLFRQFFRLLKKQRKAVIQGRDFTDDIRGFIRTLYKSELKTVNMKSSTERDRFYRSVAMTDFLIRAAEWTDAEVNKEQRKKYPSMSRMISIQDRLDCLTVLSSECETISDMLSLLDRIFSDKTKGCITLSTIHRAKGLEASHVYLLEPKGGTVPHPMAEKDWEKQQEYNLRYVAVTRAIHHLYLVTERTDND